MNDNILAKVQLFTSVFKGREDVFAIRWEKGSKSVYMPAYLYDQYMYRAHKMKGGTFQNFNSKSYLKLTDEQIEKHLLGEQFIGVYPLLADNTSWFLVADFDKANWIEESNRFIAACNEKSISTYLERSRSGNGGHVWIFFEKPYPAFRSRRIFISILEQSGAFSVFDKSLSFDRLFPNQDYLSGKGLGNLIALPLNKKTYEQGNSCFIDKDTLLMIPNQWNFLQNIERTSIEKLDNLYQEITNSSASTISKTNTGQLVITLNNVVRMSRDGMSTSLINFLKEELNFANSEYIIKKKISKNTFGTERYFKFVEETESEVIVPRGFIGKIIRFCRDKEIPHIFTDERKKQKPVTKIGCADHD